MNDAVAQLRQSGAHMGIFTETRIQTQDRHSRIVIAFTSCGYLFLSHNTSSRDMDFAIDSLYEVVFGPRAAGVIVLVLDSYADGRISLTMCRA